MDKNSKNHFKKSLFNRKIKHIHKLQYCTSEIEKKEKEEKRDHTFLLEGFPFFLQF